MRELRNLCTTYDACLILDEIQSGYGRSGKFFAHQYAGIKPDLISVAKGIANGFPMGVLADQPENLPVGGMPGTTLAVNHLLRCRYRCSSILQEDERFDNAAVVPIYWKSFINFLGIKEIRGRGLMIGIEFEESIKEVRSKLLFEEKVFTGVAGTHTIRLLPLSFCLRWMRPRNLSVASLRKSKRLIVLYFIKRRMTSVLLFSFLSNSYVN